MMAKPLSDDEMVRALRAEGVRVYGHRSWRTHNRNHRGSWGPINGVMIHHTVSRHDDSSVELCYNGHSSLPGPLCHAVGRNDGRVALVSNGRANHAGLGDDDVMRDVVAERGLSADNEANTDGNSRFYGIELVNMGDGRDTYTAEQYDQAVRWAAAICRAYGWSAGSVIGHREWQPGKIDPRGPVERRGDFDMDEFRRDVQARLDGASNADSEDEVSYETVWKTDGKMSSPWASDDNPTWQPESVLERTAKGVHDLEREVAEIKATLAELDLEGFKAALESLTLRFDVK